MANTVNINDYCNLLCSVTSLDKSVVVTVVTYYMNQYSDGIINLSDVYVSIANDLSEKKEKSLAF